MFTHTAVVLRAHSDLYSANWADTFEGANGKERKSIKRLARRRRPRKA